MNEAPQFRTSDEEISKLLRECSELRQTLKAISAQLARMENRIKLAFPNVVHQRQPTRRAPTETSLSAEDAQLRFNELVALASEGKTLEAERELESISAADLLAVTKQVGVSFPRSKPSVRAMRDAILGKIRESLLLSRQFHRV